MQNPAFLPWKCLESGNVMFFLWLSENPAVLREAGPRQGSAVRNEMWYQPPLRPGSEALNLPCSPSSIPWKGTVSFTATSLCLWWQNNVLFRAFNFSCNYRLTKVLKSTPWIWNFTFFCAFSERVCLHFISSDHIILRWKEEDKLVMRTICVIYALCKHSYSSYW